MGVVELSARRIASTGVTIPSGYLPPWDRTPAVYSLLIRWKSPLGKPGFIELPLTSF